MKTPLFLCALCALLLSPLLQGAVFTYPDGLKLAFNPSATLAGLNVGAHAGDPSTLTDGDIWYNSATGTLRLRAGGSTISLGAGGGGGLITGEFGGTGVANTGKTLTLGGSYTLNGTTGSTLNIGTGGTLGAAAFVGATTGGAGNPDAGKALLLDAQGSISGSGAGITAAFNAVGANDVTVLGTLHIQGGDEQVSLSGTFTGERALTIPDESGTLATQEWANGSNITSLGTVTTGEWEGGTIALNKGGTGATTAAGARTSLGLVAVAVSGSASDLTAGTVPDARFPATLPAASGANLTALNATQLTSGTVPDARFPATLPAASGANLTALNGSNIASGTIPVTVGGTGRQTGTTAYGLIAAGTTATGAQQTLAAGATTEILVGGGAAALPAWTTATGSGAPVRATSPTLTTPAIFGGGGFNATLNADGLTAARTLAAPDEAGTLRTQESWSVNSEDEFLSSGVGSTTHGELGWQMSAVAAFLGSEAGHPGISRISDASGGAVMGMWGNYGTGSANGQAAFNGMTVQAVFRVSNVTTAQGRYEIGISYVNSYASNNGSRVLTFDKALSNNWRIRHITQTGPATAYVDTGKAAVANDWVRVKLVFSSSGTVCTIATTSSPTDATVTSTDAFAHTTNGHAPVFVVDAQSGGVTCNMDIDLFKIYGATTRL